MCDKQYKLMALSKKDMDSNPFAQFDKWYKESLDTNIMFANAFVLSTSTPDGIPSSRVLLLKDFNKDGFRFYTNSNSKKGDELSKNVFATICFWWEPLERQIRIDGKVQILSSQESDKYFLSRPRGSQIGAWASNQSCVIKNREELDKKYLEVKKKFKGKEIPRPDYWNGYILKPHRFEFWQGRIDRLHDRISYRLNQGDNWIMERLQP